MKKHSRLSLFALLTVGAAWCGEAAVRNPFIWADVPDVSIVKVGCDYYMSSTTMHMSPGVPIMHSTDLANWTTIDYCYDRLAASNERLELRNGKDGYGHGSWASSIRWHDGWLYVATFAHDTGKTHIYRTRKPGSGVWESFAFAPVCHDLSLWFDDDGKTYLITGSGQIWIHEVKPDFSGLVDGASRVLIANANAPVLTGAEGERASLPAEGSQLVKVDGWYYLFNICSPPNKWSRTVLCHRARSLAGPWEGKVLLQDRGIAQGSIVEGVDGGWIGYFFEDKDAVGRCPWLVRVTWQDGWPVLGRDGRAEDVLDAVAATSAQTDGVPSVVRDDEFARQPGERALPLEWQWNHVPDNALWSVDERAGWLRLKSGETVAELPRARNQLTQRTFGPSCATVTRLDVTGLREGDFAGLSLFQKCYSFIGVTVRNGQRVLVQVSAPDGKMQIDAETPLSAETVWLRARADFTAHPNKGGFAYSLDGVTWQPFGRATDLFYTMPHFMGYRFGLFIYSTAAAGGHADFDFFRFVRP